jgi:ADP-ribosylglycohydrolase
MFQHWIAGDARGPYDSYGNGAAMRASGAALLGRGLDDALRLAERITAITHNHPEGLKGAMATVLAIRLARAGEPPDAIRAEVAQRAGYAMDLTVDGIRPGYRFDESCQRTVPQALVCALEATDFEDALRNAVSIGGDTDTIACIAGGVAEARFGIPAAIATQGLRRLPAEMVEVVRAAYRRAGLEAPLPPT